MDHGIDSIKDAGSPLIPFVMFEKRGGSRELHRFMTGNSPAEAVEEARKHISELPDTVCSYALVYDGAVTIDSEKSPAVLVEAAERTGQCGFRMFQRFRPKSLFRAFQNIGNPGLLGPCEIWFSNKV